MCEERGMWVKEREEMESVCVCVGGGGEEGRGGDHPKCCSTFSQTQREVSSLEAGFLPHVRWTSGENAIATQLPLLPADAVQVRETAKLGGVIQWVQGQLLHREKS